MMLSRRLVKWARSAVAVGLIQFTSTALFAMDDLPEYESVSGISGNLSSAGSDTLANMMTLWAEAFQKHYPQVRVQVQAAGSSTAPPALTLGTSQLAPMSREMKDKEIEAFEKQHGYKPTEIPVAIDALAIFVHKDNPIQGMSIEDVDAIFSANRQCGAAQPVEKWGQLGIKGPLADKTIQLFGRNSVSGTYGYFKEVALCKGDFKNNVNEQPGSASVVQSVSTSLNGIGYSGIGYITTGVRPVPLSKKGDKFVEATKENAISGKYPLSRKLYVYVNKTPGKPLDPLTREFVRLMLSKQGQLIVSKDGYVPLPRGVVDQLLAELGIMDALVQR